MKRALGVLAVTILGAAFAGAQSPPAQKQTTPPPAQKQTTPPPAAQKQATPPAQKQATPPAQKQATPPAQKQATPPAQKAAQDTGSATVAERGSRSQLSIMRETFTYSDGGRRDPMISLMGTSDIRPLITELKLLSVFYDEGGGRSNAFLQNTTDKKLFYRVKVGQMLGRMTVTQITRTDVVFTIDEYGLNRQERLSIKPDTSGAKTP